MIADSKTSSLIMIVDPESERRSRLIASFGRDHVIDAISLHEAYSLVEEVQPKIVVLSDSAARASGLSMFIQLANLIGASCVVYGMTPPEDLPGSIPWIQFLDGENPRKILENKPGSISSKPRSISKRSRPEMIVIGASTGGVSALEHVISKFTAECPPTLIVQHIRPGFAESMVQRLERCCAPRVVKAHDGVSLSRGTVYVAADTDYHLTILGVERPRCAIIPGSPAEIHKPSVDALFHSAAVFGSRVSAALLTGMGADGAAGLAAIRNAGGLTIAQDKATSTVYGMPRVAAEIGAATAVLPLDSIATALLEGLPPSTQGYHQ